MPRQAKSQESDQAAWTEKMPTKIRRKHYHHSEGLLPRTHLSGMFQNKCEPVLATYDHEIVRLGSAGFVMRQIASVSPEISNNRI